MLKAFFLSQIKNTYLGLSENNPLPTEKNQFFHANKTVKHTDSYR